MFTSTILWRAIAILLVTIWEVAKLIVGIALSSICCFSSLPWSYLLSVRRAMARRP